MLEEISFPKDMNLIWCGSRL